MADNEVSFLVKLKDEFSNGINKVIKGFTGLDSATAKSNVSTTALGVVFGNLATKAVELALNGVKKLGTFLLDSVYANAEAERASNALAASLQSIGITSQYALNDLKNYSTQLQSLSGIADEVFQDGMRLLTNFGLVGDELKRATASAYNLSLGLNMDLKSAFQLVARGAEGNLTMFSRYGLTVDNTKSKSEQFAEILDKIDGKFGQLAGANANNLITKTNALKESWGDFKEQIGAALTPLAQWFTDILAKGITGLSKSFTFLTDITNILMEGLVQGFNKAELAVLKTKASIQSVIVKFQEYGNMLGMVSDETLQNSKDSIDNINEQIKQKKEEIRLFKEQTKYLASERDNIAANFEASREAAQKQQEQAKANFEVQKQMEEARKQAAEEAKQAEENAAKEAEARVQRLNDFRVNAEENILSQVAVLRETADKNDFAALDAKNKQEYESKINFLQMQLEAVREKEGEGIAIQSEKYEQLRIMEEQYQAYLDESEAVQQERGLRINALDQWLASSKYQAQSKVLNDISNLQNAKNKEMAAVGKAAAIANAIMTTYQAANLALATVAPPWGYVQAAISTAMGLANVAQISGVQLAVGTPNVPEDMPATVHQGEIIIPRTFSEGLRSGDLVMSATDDLAHAGGDMVNSGNINVHFNGDVLSDSPESISRKLAEVLSQQIAGGQISPLPTGERM